MAGLGAFLVLALLATGAYSLYSVLTAAPQQSRTQAAASVTGSSESAGPRSGGQRGSPASNAAARSRPPTLAIAVTGPRCYVSVRVPDGKTLLNETLHHGETVRFDRPALEVTVGDPGAVQIKVNGKPRKPARRGIDTFTVSRRQ